MAINPLLPHKKKDKDIETEHKDQPTVSTVTTNDPPVKFSGEEGVDTELSSLLIIFRVFQIVAIYSVVAIPT